MLPQVAALVRSGRALMQLTVVRGTESTMVTVSGDLDVSTAGEFRATLQHAIDDSAGSLVVDLTGVEFLGSTALGVLTGDRHTAAQRNLFNRLLGCLHHCLQTGQRYNEATAFPTTQTEEQGAAA